MFKNDGPTFVGLFSGTKLSIPIEFFSSWPKGDTRNSLESYSSNSSLCTDGAFYFDDKSELGKIFKIDDDLKYKDDIFGNEDFGIKGSSH